VERRKAPRRPFKSFLFGFGILLLALVGGGAALLYRQFTTGLPPVEKLLDYKPPVTTRVLSNDGTVVAEFYVEKRYLTPIYKIPRMVQLAFVAAEDASFYDHRGIDLISIGRAALNNYRAGSTRQGGSTITQQVVKALLLTPERSYERKLKEMFLAIQLEHELTKDEILYLYLNQIYLGNGAYGVQAAANEYFGKDVAQLTTGEAALLAGLPQAPSRYSPTRNMEHALRRQRYVLRQMVNAGFLTHEEALAAEQEPIVLAKKRSTGVDGLAPYFVEHVRRFLVGRYGGNAAYQIGLDVHTTLDLRMQAAADRAVREGVAALDERQGFRGPRKRLTPEQWKPLVANAHSTTAGDLPETGATLEVVVIPGRDGRVRSRDGGVWVRWASGITTISPAGFAWATRGGYEPAAGDMFQARVAGEGNARRLEIAHDNATQGALIAIRPGTGDVTAMVGGLDWGESQFNRATQALRQPGSAFKPLIYTAALDRGFTPTSIISDTPVSYHVGPGQTWSPKNFNDRFQGPTTLREALTKSLNVVTVKLVDAMGLRYLLNYLPRFGLDRPFPKNLSIALGSSEVTLLELACAYGVFANLGQRVEPRFITAITDRQGRLLDEFPVRSEAAIPPETAYLTVNLMRSVVENGTGKRAKLDRPVAGKTGTTNDMRDAWFVGYTPELLAGVWVGYDQDRTLGKQETGGRSAAPVWKSFMETALATEPVRDFDVPADIILVNVDKSSGTRGAPGQPGTILEAYRRGTEPAAPSAEPEPASPHEQARAYGPGYDPWQRPSGPSTTSEVYRTPRDPSWYDSTNRYARSAPRDPRYANGGPSDPAFHSNPYRADPAAPRVRTGAGDRIYRGGNPYRAGSTAPLYGGGSGPSDPAFHSRSAPVEPPSAYPPRAERPPPAPYPNTPPSDRRWSRSLDTGRGGGGGGAM